MHKKWWFALVLVGVFLVGIFASGCGPSGGGGTPTTTGTPSDWVPEVPGMKPGEEKLFFEWRASINQADTKGQGYYNYMAQEWEKRTKGHMKLIPYFNRALGDDNTNPYLLGAGVFEMAQINGLFGPKEMPLDMIINIPFFIDVMPEDWEISEALVWGGSTHPQAQAIMAQLNLINIGHYSQHIPYMFQSRRGVTLMSAADWKGKLMRAPGFMATVARELGAVPVQLVGSTYEFMQKGQYDMILLTPSGLVTAQQWEVTEGIIFRPVSRGHYVTSVNLELWNKLPQYIKDVYNEMIPDVKKFSREESLSVWDDVNRVIKERGVKVFDFPDAEWEKIKQAGVAAHKAWQEHNKSLGLEKQWQEYYSDMIILRNKYLAEREGHPWNLYLPPGLKPEVYPK